MGNIFKPDGSTKSREEQDKERQDRFEKAGGQGKAPEKLSVAVGIGGEKTMKHVPQDHVQMLHGSHKSAEPGRAAPEGVKEAHHALREVASPITAQTKEEEALASGWNPEKHPRDEQGRFA